MKILLRMQTLLLVLCLALPLAACGGKTDPGNETSEKTDPPDTGDGLHDSDGYLLDHLPDSLDYGKEKINILYWNNAPTYEFSTDSDTALTTIENAVFARNSNVEERLNVVLNFIRPRSCGTWTARSARAPKTMIWSPPIQWSAVP